MRKLNPFLTALGTALITASLVASTALGSAAGYVDQRQIPDWAVKDVLFTTQSGVFQGDDAGTFRPGDQITRAELTAALMRSVSLDADAAIRLPFADVAGGWYESVITEAVQAGVICADDFGARFRPNQAITRAEMARMVVRAVEATAGAAAPRAPVTFADVDPDEGPFGPFIMKAAGYGIINGMGDGTFAPDQTATRAQAAVIIARAMRLGEPQPGAEEPGQGAEEPSGLQEFEERVAELVNQEREAAGLKPLRLDPDLSRVARLKSQDFVTNGYFSHTSPTYGSPFEMMKQFGISYWSAGENIAKGQRTPERVHQSWMNSEGHRRNIMDPNYDTIGVGFYEYGWTQMFIQSR